MSKKKKQQEEKLYDKNTFIYYFEKRLKDMVKAEVESYLAQVFYSQPF